MEWKLIMEELKLFSEPGMEVATLPETRASLDFWDDLNFQEKGIPNSLYYYFIEGNKIKNIQKPVVPPVDAVIAVNHAPYIQWKNVLLREVEFDTARFPVNTSSGEKIEVDVANLQRITSMDRELVPIATGTKPKRSSKPTKDSNRSWKNEGKLFHFPYTYGLITDGMNTPLEFKYHMLSKYFSNGGAEFNLWAKIPLTNMGTYSLYIDNYQGEFNGLLNNVRANKSNQLPCVSNTYMNFMSQNKAQFSTQKNLGLAQSIAGLGIAAVGAGLTATGYGATIGIGMMASGAGMMASGYSTTSRTLAQERDLTSSPAGLNSMGSDALFDVQAGASLWHYRMRQTDEYMTKIGDYFAMYGYKQNKIMNPELRSRYYYNYIKTVGANVKASGVPKEHFMILKNIYDNGTTIWHADRSGVSVGNYSKDNSEV